LIEQHLQRLIERLNQPQVEWPQQVKQQARWLVLDTLGCAIAGGRAPTVRAWLDGQHLRADPFATTAGTAPIGPSPGGEDPMVITGWAAHRRSVRNQLPDLIPVPNDSTPGPGPEMGLLMSLYG
jgi:hypothetical protein